MEHDQHSQHIWEPVGEVMVTRTLPGAIPEHQMNGFINDVRANADIRVVFAVVSGTVTITATQRADVAKLLKERKIAAVVMTDAALTRGIITAISWLGGNMKGFGWSDLEKALDYVEVTPDTRERLRTIAQQFRADLDAM